MVEYRYRRWAIEHAQDNNIDQELAIETSEIIAERNHNLNRAQFIENLVQEIDNGDDADQMELAMDDDDDLDQVEFNYKDEEGQEGM